MSEENVTYGTHDLVNFAVDQKPDSFRQAFNQIIVDKLQAAVDERKREVANSIFGLENEVESSDEVEETEDSQEEE